MSLQQKINQFVARFLHNREIAHYTTSKFIHDPIWGTIELQPYEYTILDTPLLQRLRQIHQTGCAYATYPCATHTRFEHTLGVVHLAGRMSLQLQHKYPDEFEELRLTEKKTRLAALMHDTGHGSFSHTSEEIYKNCGDLKKLLNTGGKFAGKGAGEVLSYLIVTSKPFRDFFSKLKKIYPKELKSVEINGFAPLILGRSEDPKKQYEADIISGAFDADKLDYFPRDGRAAGIDLSLDIEHLIHCIELSNLKKLKENVKVLAVHRGGYNAIQQLLFVRATLFSTMYHHHKVRACDCMIKGVYEVFRKKKEHFKKNPAFSGVDLKSAADFLHITDADFFAEAYSHKSTDIRHKIIHDVLYRRILKRVLTISTKTVKNFDDVKDGYSAFFNLGKNPEELRKFAIAVWEKANKPCYQEYVWIDIPNKPNFNKAGEAQINIAPRGIECPQLKPLAEFIPVKQWLDTYETHLLQSFLFGPPEVKIRTKLADAAKNIFKEHYNLEFEERAFVYDLNKKLKQ